MVKIHFLFGSILISLTVCKPINKRMEYALNPAVVRLQDYIRIDTSTPDNYDLVLQFWKKQAAEIKLPIAIYRPADYPVCIISWQGTRPELPSILLNSHSDVVKAEAKYWKYPPFSGAIDDNGDLYGRGAQDTKSLAIQHLEAIRNLINNNVKFERTFHISILPDEETGGNRGIIPFIKTQYFKRLNVGFVLDEGITSSTNIIYAAYQDKRPWQMNMTIYGRGGHGATIQQHTAVEKLHFLLNSVMKYRSQQNEIMSNADITDVGSYTTVNMNIIQTGLATNIIPTMVNTVIDMRLATTANVSEVQQMVDEWQSLTGPNSELEYIRREDFSPATVLDETNLYWGAMQEAAKELDIEIKPVVCGATSDMLQLRKLGIPALGFAPRRNMVSRIHDIDEYISIDGFLNGIQIFEAIINKLGNLSVA